MRTRVDSAYSSRICKMLAPDFLARLKAITFCVQHVQTHCTAIPQFPSFLRQALCFRPPSYSLPKVRNPRRLVFSASTTDAHTLTLASVIRLSLMRRHTCIIKKGFCYISRKSHSPGPTYHMEHLEISIDNESMYSCLQDTVAESPFVSGLSAGYL